MASQASSVVRSGAQVRSKFINFFTERKHLFVPSSPVVPHDDPTLLFANAGMNQFKGIFLGNVTPGSDLDRYREAGAAVNSQKCIRAGGKHNDLDDVGKDVYHHTFFEMLGCFSFGQYEKKGAIDLAWAFLTSEEGLGIDKDRFYVTYFEGNEALGLKPDLETKELWLRYVPEERILPGNMKDNFWEMGDVGPCGPASEIHYDRVGGRDASHLVNQDDPLVVEVWNLVFMSYHRAVKDGPLNPLPRVFVDTGMGFERLLAIVQRVQSNYDTDIWQPIFNAIQRVTKCPRGYHGGMTADDIDVAYRVVADHIRSCVLAIADGARPHNDGRNYVIRRIARRAIRMGREYLCPADHSGVFFHRLVGDVIGSFEGAFPDLLKPNVEEDVTAILAAEEAAFARLVPRGLAHLKVSFADADARGSKVISGRDAFVLHDRYGFPLDLTKICCEKAGYEVDEETFDQQLQIQRLRAGKKAGEVKFPFGIDEVTKLKEQGVPPTNADHKYTWEAIDSKIVAIFKCDADGKNASFVEELAATEDADRVAVILEATPFYAEGGGQIADTGDLVGASGATFEVSTVSSNGPYVLHLGAIANGAIKVGDVVSAKVDYARRHPIAVNHTMTHVLNWVLREELLVKPTAAGVVQKGAPQSVDQRGSYVNDEMLRFDFSWPWALTKDQIKAVEASLSGLIAADLSVKTASIPMSATQGITGIRAMFDDKYGADVRVVFVGVDPEKVLANPSSDEWTNYSIELCGGTHISSLGETGVAAVVEETSTTAGVRRIRIVTGTAAKEVLARASELTEELRAILTGDGKASTVAGKEALLRNLQNRVKLVELPVVAKAELQDAIGDAIKDCLKAKKGDVAGQKAAASAAGAAALAADADAKFSVTDLTAVDAANFTTASVPRDVFAAFAAARRAEGAATPVFVSVNDGAKVSVWASVPTAAGVPFTAPEWIKEAVGRGGGRGEEAQSGTDFANLAATLERAQAFAASKLA